MNYLCHLYLSGSDPELLVGNFMGDHVKGRLQDQYPARVLAGVMLHRRIDSFAQHNRFFQLSRGRISPSYGLYRGVLVDLFYDHFLAAEWHDWSKEPFSDYLQRVRLIIDGHSALLPERLRPLVPLIIAELLPSYRQVDGIATALERMSRRLKRANPLAGGAAELVSNYQSLRDDFRSFMPQVRDFTTAYIATVAD